MKLKNMFFTAILIILITTFLGCEYMNINYRLKYSETVEKKIELNENTMVNIDNINGYIKLTSHDKNYISISAEKFSNKKEYLDKIKLYFKMNGNKLDIYSEREKKRMKFKINYTVLVPKGLRNLKITSVNGSVKANGEFNGVGFSTTNGSVKLNGSFGDADISTTNGSIKVIQTNVIKGNINIRTTNGSVRLTLNGDSNFKIKGNTTNGSIACEFPVTIKRRITSSKINGEVGDAKYTVSLSTTNGSIKIYKR